MPPEERTDRWIHSRARALLDRVPDNRALSTFADVTVGTARGTRPRNEDRALVVRTGLTGPPRVIAVLCDGMGGMIDGAECASVAAATFIDVMVATPHIDATVALDAIARANDALYQRYRGDGGSTIVAYVDAEGGSFIVHAGDSRAYYVERDGGRVRALTRDDTLAALAADRHDDDRAAPTDNRLVQFVGSGPELRPHVTALPRSKAGYVLLTSDGAHGPANGALADLARTAETAAEVCERLLTFNAWTGGRDNASAIAVLPGSRARAPREALTFVSASGLVEVWGDRVLSPSPNRPRETGRAASGTKGKAQQLAIGERAVGRARPVRDLVVDMGPRSGDSASHVVNEEPVGGADDDADR